MKLSVDKELLPMKAHYFLFNAGTAPVVPFMPTLARQLGFSEVVIGTIYMILPIVGMLAKPFFGFIADRYQRHRMLFLCAEVLTAIAFFLIMFIPAIPQPTPTIQFHCNSGYSILRHCSDQYNCVEANLESKYANQTLTCNMHCEAKPQVWDIVCENWLHNDTNCIKNRTNEYLDFITFLNMNDIMQQEKEKCILFTLKKDQGQINGQNVTLYCPKEPQFFNSTCTIDCGEEYFSSQLSNAPVIENSQAMRLYQFWFLFILLILSWIGMAVVVSIGDAICFSILGERQHLYGNQRLYGSIGWGVFSIIAGLLVDQMSHGSVTKDYTIVFWMTAIIIGFDVFASTKLKHTQTHLSANILKDVGAMFLSIRCVVFFLWCIFIGLCTALIWNFLFLYLEDLATGCQNSMKTLQGFAMGIQCFGGELPFFFLSGWILKKIGHVNAMSLVLFGFGVRFILYSMLEDAWYVLPIELLNGVTFGVFYSTMASYASIVAPPGTEATMQSLVGAIFEGIGVSMGSLIGGILYSTVGGGHMYAIFGTGAFVAFVVHVCVQMYLQRNGNSFSGTENGAVKYLAPTDAMHMLNEQEYSIVS
ncbi:major facilitator superfamily domain-containing protein 6 isoform X2 [Teleopsis dalmanni]|uniref:major facilitator superfamily domain-containing protein 6 isoform X2 n=1 Tax=Teleopsis dalmanni TaxID=139649 RepID=UPI0018CDA649|nr:major facilitator superfamily domain-containing protein 6 isoform X2 [Teleopsis dalmanni]